MALDIDYTSPLYNAFCDVATMDSAMIDLGVLYTATFWADLDAPNKEALIKASTRNINSLVWKGDQNPDILVPTMLYPRINLDGAEDTVIPEEIILRMGCWIIHNATANGNGSGNGKAGAVKAKNVGGVNITYETKADLIKASNSVATDPCENYAQNFIYVPSMSFGIGGVSKQRSF